MKTTPTMQAIITHLAPKNGFDVDRMSLDPLELRLPNPASPLLVIRSMFLREVTVSLSYPDGNAFEVDRRVTFYTGNGEWIPVHVFDETGRDRIYGEFDEFEGRFVARGDAEEQARLASDCEMWAHHLEQDRWVALAEQVRIT